MCAPVNASSPSALLTGVRPGDGGGARDKREVCAGGAGAFPVDPREEQRERAGEVDRAAHQHIVPEVLPKLVPQPPHEQKSADDKDEDPGTTSVGRGWKGYRRWRGATTSWVRTDDQQSR